MIIHSLSTTEPKLTTLLQLIVEEFVYVAAKSERYREGWERLTPYVAIDLVLRRRQNVDWLRDARGEKFDAELSECFDMVWPAIIALQRVVDEARTLDSASDIEARYDAWLQAPISVIERYRDTVSLQTIRETYEQMLQCAVGARLAKLDEAPKDQQVFRTRDSSLAIEQIRISAYSKETVFIFDKERLPVNLQRGVSGAKCLAVTVPDAWIAKCDAFVNFSAPSFGLVDNCRTAQECVLQLASGWVRLDAAEVNRFLYQFDDELPVVFVGKEICALAVHEFFGLADCASIDATLAHLGELDGLIPVLNDRLSFDDETSVKVDVKSRVLNAVSYAGVRCNRSLSDIPDAIDEVPF